MKKFKPEQGITYPQRYMSSVTYVKPLWMVSFEQLPEITFYMYKSGRYYFIAEASTSASLDNNQHTTQNELLESTEEFINRYLDRIPGLVTDKLKELKENGATIEPKYN